MRAHNGITAILPLLFAFSTVTADPLLQTEPESVGMSSGRLKHIGGMMQNYVDQGEMSGLVVLVLRKGSIVHYESYGWRNIEEKEAMQKDDLFNIFSMTKTIISAAALVLMEEGKFILDDPVSRFLPEFGNPKVYVEDRDGKMVLEDAESPILIRHLFTHTSGLSYGTLLGEDNLYTKRFAEENLFDEQKTLEEMVDQLAGLPLRYHPGTTFGYGFSTDVLARLAEVASGQPINALLKERIFDPLGMKDTSYIVPETKWDRVAAIYATGESGSLEISSLDGDYYKDRRCFAGGHGLVSTAMDYACFSQMLLNKGELNGTRLLSPRTVELMTSNFLRGEKLAGYLAGLRGFDLREYGFGLGVKVIIDPLLHGHLWSKGTYTSSGYTNTYCFADPEEELAGVFMSQHFPYNFDSDWYRFTNLVYQAIVE